MTHITMQVARWGSSLALIPAEEDVSQFTGVRLEVLYCDGQLLFAPSEGGTSLHYKRREGLPEPVHAYEFQEGRPGSCLEDLVRFAVHEVELSLDDDGTMTWDMPPMYELPWPRHVRQLSFDRVVALAERELTRRVGSAADDYAILCRVATSVPDWARRVLRGNVWNDIFGRTR